MSTLDYLSKIKNIPDLTEEKERELIQDSKRGNNQSRIKLTEAYLKLIVEIAKQYLRYAGKLDLLDLIQEGSIGFLRAIEKYEPEKKYPFRYYVSYWIKWSIIKDLISSSRIIRIPHYVYRLISEFFKIEQKLFRKLKRNASFEEIIKEMGITAQKAEKLHQALKNGKIFSIDDLTDKGEKDRWNTKEIGDFIVDKRPNPEQINQKKGFKEEMRKIPSLLPEKKEKIIRMFFGIEEKRHTLIKIGQKFGRKTQQIHQIKQKGLKELRQILTEKKQSLSDFFDNRS